LASGRFCWVELAAGQKRGALDFYSALFGWTPREESVPLSDARKLSYTLWRRGDDDVAGMYELLPEQRASGMQPQWLPYVSVDDIEAASALGRSLSGVVLAQPIDVLEAGRMAILRDPAGARIGLWEARALEGFRPSSDPGAPCSLELATHELVSTRRFYGELFGWRSEDGAGEEQSREVLARDGRPVASLRRRESSDAPAAGWTTLFAVADCERACGLVAELGGRVVSSTEAGAGRRLALAQDPQGIAFGMLAER
jgi:predicted enzyme related to lactoylglutathione lyase